MTTARDEIIARIRAIPRLAPPATPRAYRRETTLDRAAVVRLFCERVADYRAEVRAVSGVEVAGEIAAAFERRHARRVGFPPGLPAEWRPAGGGIEDDELSVAELDGLDGVVTGCTVAIAETGTIVLAGGPDAVRRALTLVPDLHICVVQASQIVASVPEATAVLEPLVRDERRPLTLVSGPSATSDIELDRVEGVHGPRSLVVLVVAEEPAR
jgi:L-lactate dehydrogenase complex protein LldG